MVEFLLQVSEFGLKGRAKFELVGLLGDGGAAVDLALNKGLYHDNDS